MNASSSEPTEVEPSQTGDEEPDNSQAPDYNFINIYAKELLNQNVELMIPTTFVGFEKW